MKLEVDTETTSFDPADRGVVEISDVKTAKGTVTLFVDEFPDDDGWSAAVEISRDDATKICEHLIRVFGLLTLSPYGDAEKKPGSPKYGVPR